MSAAKRPDLAYPPGPPAWAGVDTHAGEHTLALIDALGRHAGAWEFPATPEGCDALAARIGDASVPVGVEGARSYGACLVERLCALGFEVFEVTRPRREQRRRGKSDEIDAYAAAENLAAGKGHPVKSLAGEVARLRGLMVARDGAVKSNTANMNRLVAMVTTAPSRVRSAFSGLSGAALARRVASSRIKDGCMEGMASLARSWLRGEREAARLEARISEVARGVCPALVEAFCVGGVTAARLILAAGANPGRMKSEAAFSMLCGVSPIPAGSGSTDGRHRLNRGGDRQANRAIHDIARSRMARDERTRAYIARKVSEGKTKREAVRCLCRMIARELYGLLTRGDAAPAGADLAEARRAAGLRQRDVADALGATVRKVSLVELGKECDGAFCRRYAAYLESSGASPKIPH